MKKLIYFTISNDIGYLKLLSLCIDSLNKFDYDGDILFITDLENEIRESVEFKNNVYFLNFGANNILSSSANKLKIYKYDNINMYDKIIFCDIDTMWFKSPDILFDDIQDDKIYMVSEHHQDSLMSHDFWSGDLMTRDEVDFINNHKIKGLNGGFFAFKISMISVIENIDNFLNQNFKVYKCLEQPYINTYLYRNNLYNTLFDKYISNNGNFITDFDGVLLHFSAGMGNADFKYEN
jgi:hypothetical protein